jgi:hypothetical protein
MARFFYGLANEKQLREFVVVVCGVLGHGASGGAVDLLMETAAQETHCGQFRDPTPRGAGRGVFQMDLIAFNDIRNRARVADINMVIDNFGVDIRIVNHDALDHSPLLAAIFCRLFYKLLPSAIPSTMGERAHYWKRFYNTEVGKGTVSEYINNARIYGGPC